MSNKVRAVDDGLQEAIPDPPPIAPQFVTQRVKGIVEGKDMSRRGTRTETARELIAGSIDVVKTRNIRLEIVNWTDDEDEPAYDVNVYVDGKPVEGGKGVFNTGLGTGRALRNAESFMDSLVKGLVRASGGTLRG